MASDPKPTPLDEHDLRLTWLSKTAAATLAPKRPDLQPLLVRIMREVLDQLDTLVNPSRST